MFKSILLALSLALVTSLAMADAPYVNIEQRLSADQLHTTGLDTLSPEQLAQLNTVLRTEADTQAKAEPARHEGAPGNGWSMGLDQETIKSRVKGTVTGWDVGTEFELDNGQHWKVLKGKLTLPKAMVNPEVEIAPGMAGRWFFHVDEDLPGARVYRVD